MLHLALIPGRNIGWGVCSANLVRELSRLYPCELLSLQGRENADETPLPGPVFHTIGDHHLTKVFPVTGTENYGYTFFENSLPPTAAVNARFFDRVFAGSTWCRERLEAAGISWADTLIQGIDPEIFRPLPFEKAFAADRFVIFSGGKFELRKGQDLVIRAVKVLQDRHEDVVFVNLWFNPWKFSLDTMARSPHMVFRPRGKTWNEVMANVLLDNGMDLERVVIGGQVEQRDLRKIYAATDVGVFPNRCEGGTNLVLMEYMACARPVIAAYHTGHRDILTSQNAILLERMTPVAASGETPGDHAPIWREPDLDELIEALESAYRDRDRLRRIAGRAGEDLKQWTWERSARDLLEKTGLLRGGRVR